MDQYSPDELAEELGALEDAIVQPSGDSLADELAALEAAIERIPSPAPSPQTTLQLQGRAGDEAAWQSYLRYFLDPTEPHQLGTDALNRFLQGLSALMSVDIPGYAPDSIEVIAEVQSARGNQPDLILQVPGQFFICCELKLYAGEGDAQTQRYVNDPDIGSRPKTDFPETGHHYLYIKRPGQPDATADEFHTVTWIQIRNWLTPLLLDDNGRYPARTTAQLRDFLDTIQQDMTEDAHLNAQREKMQLYFKHEAAIRQAREALETVYEYERDNWRQRFLNNYLPDSWSEDWHCNANRYGHIYHSNWRPDTPLEKTDSKIKLQFVHLIRDIDSFIDGQLTMQLRWPGESPYRERFKELFVSDQYADQLDSILNEYDIRKRADYSYANPRFTEKRYNVTKSELPDSYYETLSRAVEEHQQLATIINKMLDEAISDVENRA